ncbi:MAG: hypothetical protein ACLUU1_00365 [Ruminococcus sp.]
MTIPEIDPRALREIQNPLKRKKEDRSIAPLQSHWAARMKSFQTERTLPVVKEPAVERTFRFFFFFTLFFCFTVCREGVDADFFVAFPEEAELFLRAPEDLE